MSYSYEEDEVRSYSYQPSGIEDFATGYTEEGIPEEFVETPSDSSASSESGEDQLKKDWNAEFQEVLASKDESTRHTKLYELAEDFCYAAKLYGQIIISEFNLPVERRTIQPVSIGGIAGGEKYIVFNILFKFALDSDGLYGSDANAMKAANCELKGLTNYYNCAVEGISFPLMAIINYRGYRLVAMSLLPISKDSLIYGSRDGGRTVFTIEPAFNKKMQEAATVLNLQAHLVGKEGKLVHSCGDIEGHKGDDGRFYLLDFARVFPPQAKIRQTKYPTHLFEMLRPELVKSNPVPLSSDALTGWGSVDPKKTEYNQAVRQATNRLLQEVIPACAAQLDMISPDKMHLVEVPEELHRRGINLRFLGMVRSLSINKEIRQMLLIEAVARCLKLTMNELLRAKVRELQVASSEPYKTVVLEYLNSILSAKSAWKALKKQLQAQYPQILSTEEASATSQLKKGIDMFQLFSRFQDIAGIRFSEETFQDLSTSSRLHLVQPDIVEMEATVKQMSIVEHSHGISLLNQANQSTGRDGQRLYLLSNKKFQEANIRSPNAESFYYWGANLFKVAMLSKEKLKELLSAPEHEPTRSSSIPRLSRPTSRSSTRLFLQVEAIPVVPPSVVAVQVYDYMNDGLDKFLKSLGLQPNYEEAKSALSTLCFELFCFIVEHRALLTDRGTPEELLKSARIALTESLSQDPASIKRVENLMSSWKSNYDQGVDFKIKKEYYLRTKLIWSAKLHYEDSSDWHFGMGLLLISFLTVCIKLRRHVAQTIAALSPKLVKHLKDVQPHLYGTLENLVGQISSPAELAAFVPVLPQLPLLKQKVINHCLKFETLDFTDFSFLPEDIILQIIELCANASMIKLDNCKITDEVMILISNYCWRLRELSCKGCKLLTIGPIDEGIQNLDHQLKINAKKTVSKSILGMSDTSGMEILSLLKTGTGDLFNHETPIPETNLKKKKSVATLQRKVISRCESLEQLTMAQCSLIEPKALSLLSYFNKLTCLDLGGVNLLTEDALKTLLQQNHTYKVLRLNDCHLITLKECVSLLSKCTQLKELDISNCRSVETDIVEQIAKTCTGLTSLGLAFMKSITDSVLKYLSRLPQLAKVNLSHNETFTDVGVKSLLKHRGAALTHLQLASCKQITDTAAALLQTCVQLEMVVLTGTNISTKTVQELSKCHKLVHLDIRDCVAVADGIDLILASCPDLTFLSIGQCFSLTSEKVAAGFAERRMKKKKELILTHLDLSGLPVPEESLTLICKVCPKLTHLALSGVTTLSETAMLALAQLSELRNLKLDNATANDTCIQKLVRGPSPAAKSLRSITLAPPQKSTIQITDRALIDIAANCNKLNHIHLTICPITIEGIRAVVAECGELQDLLIMQCDTVDQVAFKQLSAQNKGTITMWGRFTVSN